MLRRIGVSIVLSILSHFVVSGQGIVINEIMADNERSISDLDGDFPDWIELYNTSVHTMSLKGYALSDDRKKSKKWELPQIDIPGHGYLLIFASGKDRRNGLEPHTNFKISSNGEALFLFYEGVLRDKVDPKPLGEDQAYGRLLDGNKDWWTLEVPSPGTSNNESNQLIFSHLSGFHLKPFDLKVVSVEGYEVRYTLDGTPPTDSSRLLDGSVFIEARRKLKNGLSSIVTSKGSTWSEPTEGVDKFTVLRCAGFYKNERRTKVYTKSFFVDRKIESTYQLPIVSLVTDSASFFDQDTGIYVPGVHYDPENPDWTGNFYQSGENWERSVHIEYYTSNGTLGFSQDAGIRIHGGRTRHFAQKSLRLYARKEYGTAEFQYPLLPQKEQDEYKRFLLRTTMGAWGGQSILKDAVAHQIVRDMDLEYQDYQPVVVFLNGEYWGIHTIRDRIDTRYLEYTKGADKDSIDLIEGNYKLVKAGSNEHYVKLLNFIDSNSLALDANYNYVSEQMDIGNYIDYQIAEMFFANIDWPANNVKLWRPQTPDGKWRWIFYDMDAAFGGPSKNMFAHATLNDTTVSYPNGPKSTFLFRNLLLNSRFRDRFIYRYAEALNQHFVPGKMAEIFYEAKDQYATEVERHTRRWTVPEDYEAWENVLSDDILPFIVHRPCMVEDNLLEFFGLESFAFSCDGNSVEDDFFQLIPNPASSHFAVYNKTEASFIGQLEVYSLSGQLMLSDYYLSIPAFEKVQYDISHLDNGAYFVVLTTPHDVVTKKLIVIR